MNVRKISPGPHQPLPPPHANETNTRVPKNLEARQRNVRISGSQGTGFGSAFGCVVRPSISRTSAVRPVLSGSTARQPRQKNPLVSLDRSIFTPQISFGWVAQRDLREREREEQIQRIQGLFRSVFLFYDRGLVLLLPTRDPNPPPKGKVSRSEGKGIDACLSRRHEAGQIGPSRRIPFLCEIRYESARGPKGSGPKEEEMSKRVEEIPRCGIRGPGWNDWILPSNSWDVGEPNVPTHRRRFGCPVM